MTKQEIEVSLIDLGYSYEAPNENWVLEGYPYHLKLNDVQLEYFYPNYNSVILNSFIDNEILLESWISRTYQDSINPPTY